MSLAAGAPTPQAVIPLIPYPVGTDTMTVHATVRRHAGVFLFDTGEGVSSVTPAFAKAVGGKVWGQMTGYRMTGERLDTPRCDGLTFDMAGQHFTAPIAGVFDIMTFLPPNAPPLDGSLGLDLFAGRAVTLELARHRLVVESPASLAARIKQGKEIPIRLVRDAEGVALSVDAGVPTPDGMAWMELDSGNGGSLVVAKHVAALLRLNPDTKQPQPAHFEIGGGIPVEGNARINDTLIMDGNIGARFLRNWALTLDLSRGRAWLAPAHNG